MKHKIIAGCLFLLMSSADFAASSVEFFASNNKRIIDLHTAYQRMIGQQQQDLRNDTINVMQKNHIEQGELEDVLGAYQSIDQRITAENSEHYITSQYQNLSDEQVFSLAKDLAVTLTQESVAVFIPDQSALGDIKIHFVSQQPTISEVVSLIQTRLPAAYSNAYSLYLASPHSKYEQEKVTDIEWLGSKSMIDDIKKAFPNEIIEHHNGRAYLVYQNGQTEKL